MKQRISLVSWLIHEIFLMTVGLGGALFAMCFMAVPAVVVLFTHRWAAEGLPQTVFEVSCYLFYAVLGLFFWSSGVYFYLYPERFGQPRRGCS
jgi:hypothetical protein